MTNRLNKMNLFQLIELSLHGDNRCEGVLAFHQENISVICHAAGSSHNHQAWPGGYADHIADLLRINIVTYDALQSLRSGLLPFTIAEASMALLFHDAEKPVRYGPADNAWCAEWQKEERTPAQWEEAKWEVIAQVEKRYGFVLSAEERHAIKFAHGEIHEHRKDKRMSSELAAHVHHCDNTGARIFHSDCQGTAFPEKQLH